MSRKHPLNSTWSAMWRRCTKPTAKQFCDYGGRGISVCDRWKDFAAFVEDMGPRPDGYTIDRIDNDGDYTPENCRWLSRADQLLNRRNTIKVTIEGVEYRAHDLAKISGHRSITIRDRAYRGMTLEQVLYKGIYRDTQTNDAAVAALKRIAAAKTHCGRGHAFDEENTSYDPKGRKVCKACKREDWRKLKSRKPPTQPPTQPRVRPDRTHCKRGHEYTPENTYVLPQGTKVCKTCGRENLRRSRAKRGEGSV